MGREPRDQKSDPSLGQDLERLRSAWVADGRPEPPELLDLAVKNAARRAVAGSRRRPMRWLGAFATATVVVVALTLVIEQEPQAPVPVVEPGDGFRLEQDVPAAEPARRPDPAGSAAERERAVQKSAAKQADSDALRQERSAAPRPALSAEAAPAAVLSEEAPPLEAEEAALAPGERKDEAVPDAERWLRRLLELKEAGRQEELARELAAFRAAYPDYPLPPALQD